MEKIGVTVIIQFQVWLYKFHGKKSSNARIRNKQSCNVTEFFAASSSYKTP